jgi:hypothetical protein
LEVRDLQLRAGLRDSPAAERPDTGQQFGKCKGLYQIVVGAGIQAAHAIFDCVSGRQHQDGCLESAHTHGRQDLQAASARKHHVQDHQVELLRLSQVESFLAGMRQGNLVLFGLQALLQCLTQLRFVLDH